MYALADKYQLDQGLKDLCKTRFKRHAVLFRKHWSFAEACVLAFVSTADSDRGLRDVVTGIVQEHLPEILGCEVFRARLKDMGSLAIDVLMHVSKGSVATKHMFCHAKCCMKEQPTAVVCGQCRTLLIP